MPSLAVAETDVHAQLGIGWDRINALYQEQGATNEHRTLAMAATLTQEALEGAFRLAGSGQITLDESSLKSILDRAERSWVREDYYPDVSREEFYGDEKLCALLIQAASIGLEGFRTGLWGVST